MTRDRTLVGRDHKYNTYWRDNSDRYVYQKLANGDWNGWLCSLDVWERTLSKAGWIQVEVAR